ncbi:MAG: RdgB/HAM1 family non-canonical purine NTP pyrophosphatase [Actinomycetaceae bacterium]|nr:RdgB/HAM1 family non-canonical purine NTP pyrophosphatase [Actinomycetaceae bacterium]
MSDARIVLATANAHKVGEVEAILSDALGQSCAGLIAPLSDFTSESPIEDGATFAENAVIKARAAAAASGLPALADDSGLSVEIMGGAPGIFSARWCGRHGDDAANLDLLLAQMADVPTALRRAAFVCAAALVWPDGREVVEVARMEGTLLQERRGTGGFGYDPIFLADGQDVSNAELSPEAKNAISHRGQAMRAIAGHIGELLRG